MTGRCSSIRRVILARKGALRVTPGCIAVLAGACLITPEKVLAAILIAAALHELGHIAALRRFVVAIDGVVLSAWGAQIHARELRRLSYGQELLVTLAGPTVNLLLSPLTAALSLRLGWQDGLILAGAHAILGAFNLLPILPLDGGQALYLAVAWRFGPLWADAVTAVTGLVCALTLLFLSAGLVIRGGGIFFLLASLELLRGALAQLALAQNAVKV